MVFRYFLNNWLRRTAGQKIREQVVETARQQWSDAAGASDEQEPPGEPPPCHVGFVFALPEEAGGLEDLLAGVTTLRGHGFTARRGRLNGRRVVVIRSGAGAEAAAQATEALISGHHPQWIISAGFAGGLVPELHRHDLLMADSLADLSGNRLGVDLKVDPAALARTAGVHVGRLLSADRIIRLPEEKRAMGQAHQALAVDMESFAVADVCRRRQIRFLAVRVISDAVDEQLPPGLQKLAGQATLTRRVGAAAGAIWKRPASLKDMYHLRENALVASDRLGKFLTSITEQLTPLPPART